VIALTDRWCALSSGGFIYKPHCTQCVYPRKKKGGFSDNKIIKRENKWLSYRNAHMAAASAFHFPMSCPNDVVCAHVYLDCSRPARYWRVPTSLASLFLTFPAFSAEYPKFDESLRLFCKKKKKKKNFWAIHWRHSSWWPKGYVTWVNNIHVNLKDVKKKRTQVPFVSAAAFIACKSFVICFCLKRDFDLCRIHNRIFCREFAESKFHRAT
jgi:hypothetical protein